MDEVTLKNDSPNEPFPEEVSEARKSPGKWLYRIAGKFEVHEDVPAAAIVGAWQVNEHGEIVGSFQENSNYDPDKYPARGSSGDA